MSAKRTTATSEGTSGGSLGRTFAPGDMAPKHTIDHGRGTCRGCRARPSHLCAACGRPTAWVFPAGQHALTLCDPCHEALQIARAEAEATRACHMPRGRRIAA